MENGKARVTGKGRKGWKMSGAAATAELEVFETGELLEFCSPGELAVETGESVTRISGEPGFESSARSCIMS